MHLPSFFFSHHRSFWLIWGDARFTSAPSSLPQGHSYPTASPLALAACSAFRHRGPSALWCCFSCPSHLTCVATHQRGRFSQYQFSDPIPQDGTPGIHLLDETCAAAMHVATHPLECSTRRAYRPVPVKHRTCPYGQPCVVSGTRRYITSKNNRRFSVLGAAAWASYRPPEAWGSGQADGPVRRRLRAAAVAHLVVLAQNAVRGYAPIRRPSGAYLGRGACLCFSARPDSVFRVAASAPVTPGVLHSSVLGA